MKNNIVFSTMILMLCSWGSVSLAESQINQALKLCATCHGKEGISSNDAWPNLAGQQRDYLLEQMQAFRNGSRTDPLMSANLKGYSDAQLQALADHFSKLPAAAPQNGPFNEEGKRVRARCISCHGMTGNTITSHWPNLAGQKAAYLKKQLMDFKSKRRPGPVMQVIASELTDQQIADVAEYFSQL